VLPTHWVSPGAHMPVQAVPTHVWWRQGTGSANAPFALQVCIALALEHMVALGLQVPVQTPPFGPAVPTTHV
jgi:hypothetical protein